MNNLTKRSKMIIIIAACISFLLIITTTLLFIATNKSGNFNPSNNMLILTIILLAILSLVIVIVVRLRRNEYTKMFNKDYYKVYETMQDTMKNSNLTKMEKMEVISDITSMLYHAQMQKKDVKDVIGDDVNGFMERVKNSFGYRSSILFAVINGIIYLIFILTLMQGVNFLALEKGASFFNVEMSTSILPYMILISFFVLPLFRHFVAKQKISWAVFVPAVLITAYIGFHELFYRIDHNIVWIEKYLSGNFVFISSYAVVIIWACVVAICLLAKWYIRKRSIKKL